jgi:GT2 family glycosyltransferase
MPTQPADSLTFRHAVDVVIVTADDDPAALDAAIGSALDSVGVEVRVLVIDNASTPPASVVSDPRVKLYRNPKHLGAAAGRNQGVRVGRAPYACVLDSAARLHPNTLAVLAGALDDDARIGLVGPVVEGRPPEATAGRAPTLLRLATRVRGKQPQAAASDRREVDWVSEACQVFPREAFNYVGGFDEWNVLRPESVDLCLRIREAGLGIQQVTSASVAFEPEAGVARAARTLDSLAVGVRHLVRRSATSPGATRRHNRATAGPG